MSRADASPAGANAGRARAHNRRLVLGRVRAAGAIGRAAVARDAGLSTQAVSNIIAGLEADGMLVRCGFADGARGLPVVQYALDPSGGCALGVEVRPDALLAAALDLGGRRVADLREPLGEATPAAVLARLPAIRDALCEAAGADPARLVGAGLALPGPFGATGLSVEGSQLPGWEGLDAAAAAAEALGLPVAAENDANAAAMAERVGGAAERLSSYAYLYFGAGLGLGLVSRGVLVTGAHGNAGEIGHMPVPTPEGPVILERVASRLSLQRHLARSGIDAPDMEALGAAPEAALGPWVAAAAPALSHAVHVVETLFDPEAVIMGGAMPGALLDRLVAAVALPDASVSHRPDRAAPRLVRGRAGRLVATEGAAALALERLFLPSPGALH